MGDGDGFSFPTLSSAEKVPLTALSTVTDRSEGPSAEPRPVPVQALTGSDELREPIRPGKVPYQIGYSQMDWMSLCKRKPDLTGVDGGYRSDIRYEEVAMHNTEDDVWIVINRKVFNLTPYLKFHPGGIDILRRAFGKDGTKHFNKYHPWVNADALMQNCWIGVLHKDER